MNKISVEFTLEKQTLSEKHLAGKIIVHLKI